MFFFAIGEFALAITHTSEVEPQRRQAKVACRLADLDHHGVTEIST